MSEPTPSPDPPAGGGPTDPTAPPAVPTPASWTPPDPLAAPAPWAPPTPWTPADKPVADSGPDATTGWPGTTEGPGTTQGSGTTGWPGTAGVPGATGVPGTPTPTGHPLPAGPAGAFGGPYPAVPGGTTPPPGHPWPGHPAPNWPPAGYPPPYAYPGSTPPRTNGGRVVAIVIAIVAALVLALCCGCVGLGALGNYYDEQEGSGESYPSFVPDEDDVSPVPSSEPATTPSGGPGGLTVSYEVTGTDTVDIQFYDANADFFQLDEVRTPWRMAFTANDRERVQIIATPTGSGEATCRITINGKVVSKDSGTYGATCFGW